MSRAFEWRDARSPSAMLSLSATSFFLTIAFSVTLSPGQFGIAAAYWLPMTLLAAAIRAVFAEQVLVGAERVGLSGLLGISVAVTAAALVASTLIALCLGHGGLLGAVLPLVLFWGTDAVRYVRLARMDVSSLWELPGLDIARAVLALGAWIASLLTGSLEIVAVLALLVGALGFATSWRDFSLASAITFLRTRSKYESLISAQFLLSSALAQLLPSLCLAAFGTVAFGQLRLAQTFTAPVLSLFSAFQPMLIKGFAGADGPSSRRLFVRTAGGALLISILISGAIAVAAALRGPDSNFLWLMLACSVGAASAVVGQPGGAYIRVHRLGGVSLGGQVIGAVLGLLVCLIALAASPVVFAWGIASYSVLTVAATYSMLVIHLRQQR